MMNLIDALVQSFEPSLEQASPPSYVLFADNCHRVSSRIGISRADYHYQSCQLLRYNGE